MCVIIGQARQKEEKETRGMTKDCAESFLQAATLHRRHSIRSMQDRHSIDMSSEIKCLLWSWAVWDGLKHVGGLFSRDRGSNESPSTAKTLVKLG